MKGFFPIYVVSAHRNACRVVDIFVRALPVLHAEGPRTPRVIRTDRSQSSESPRLTTPVPVPTRAVPLIFFISFFFPTQQAGRTIDTDARRKAMKAKQEAERKKAAAAKEKAKKLAEKNKVGVAG